MTTHAEQTLRGLTEIAEAIEVKSESAFRFRDRTVSVDRSLPPSKRHPYYHPDPLLLQLHLAIYTSFFACVRSGGSASTMPATAPVAATNNNETDEMIRLLNEANRSQRGWDEGWTVQFALSTGHVVATKDTRVQQFQPGQFVNDAGPRLPKAGDQIHAIRHRASSGLQPGFHFIFGEAIGDFQDQFNLVRFYWNIGWEGAAPLVRAAATLLNRCQLPFRLKCPVTRQGFGRVDPVVCYAATRHGHVMMELIRRIHPEVSPFLRDPTPLFTKRLAAGLAWAENPAPGKSFGAHRCLIVAEGLVAAWKQGAGTAAARLDRIQQQFLARGLSPERPYLSRAGRDPYGLTELEL